MNLPFSGLSRRELLNSGTMGVGSLALACLLRDQGLLASPGKPELERKAYDLLPKPAPLRPGPAP